MKRAEAIMLVRSGMDEIPWEDVLWGCISFANCYENFFMFIPIIPVPSQRIFRVYSVVVVVVMVYHATASSR